MSSAARIGLLFLYLTGQPAWGLDSDRKQPVNITADHITVVEKKGYSRYQGNVLLTQGSLKITGDDLTVFVAQNKLRKIIVLGQPASLLQLPEGTITEEGLRSNVNIGIRYMAAWLSGNGCVPIFNLMEDAATAEISRAQIWQWIHHDNGVLKDGRKVTKELCHGFFDEEMEKIRSMVGEEHFASGTYELARNLMEQIVTNDELTEFLTLVGYDHLD